MSMDEAVETNEESVVADAEPEAAAPVGYTVEIYGASDDLVEVEGKAEGCDEYEALNESRAFLVTDTAGARALVAVSNHEAIWSIGVRPVEEDAPAPAVHINARGYTAVATIHNVVRVEKLA